MVNNLFIFIVALFMVIKGATLATKYAALLAESYRLSKYTVGFIIIAIISILPETFISINAALKGIPSFGLGVLFGSNIADLTLIFAAIILLAGRGLKIESKILKNHAVYPFILLLPLVLGFNGHFSRLEGIALIIAGVVFYYLALRNGIDKKLPLHKNSGRLGSSLMLLFSMAILLVGAHFTVTSATALADYFGVNPILIGMLIVGLGTTMPELFFSLKSVKKRDDSLAVGDILGTVLADATIVVGILALVNPFFFPQKIIYITGAFMVAASFILFRFMHSGRAISRKEAYLLFAFWVAFVIVEFVANT
jgi:cation:H+ antiporter